MILARLLACGRLLSGATAFLRGVPLLIAVVAIGIFELARDRLVGSATTVTFLSLLAGDLLVSDLVYVILPRGRSDIRDV